MHSSVSDVFTPRLLWLTIYCHDFRRRRYRSRPIKHIIQNVSLPGVSILRPLKGLDPNLYENLESTFKQDYTNYEIIFSVAHESDQALHVVNALITKYPQVPVTVIIGMSRLT